VFLIHSSEAEPESPFEDVPEAVQESGKKRVPEKKKGGKRDDVVAAHMAEAGQRHVEICCEEVGEKYQRDKVRPLAAYSVNGEQPAERDDKEAENDQSAGGEILQAESSFLLLKSNFIIDFASWTEKEQKKIMAVVKVVEPPSTPC